MWGVVELKFLELYRIESSAILLLRPLHGPPACYVTANPRLASSPATQLRHSHGKSDPKKRAKINYALPVVGGRAILCSQGREGEKRGCAADGWYLPVSQRGLLCCTDPDTDPNPNP